MKKLSENKRAYLLAAGMGMMASILMVAIHDIDNISVYYSSASYTLFLLLGILLPISILVFLFVLSKKIPIVWRNTKTRIICIFILLSAYIIGFYLPVCLNQLDNPSCFLWLPIAPLIILPAGIIFGIVFSFEQPTQTPLLSTFLFSSVFIISAAYFTTKGTTNLLKRIISFLVIGFLICVTMATPLIMMHLSY